MILEYSGRPLGLLHLTHWIKQLTLALLLFNAFFPLGLLEGGFQLLPWALVMLGLKLVFAVLLMAMTEFVLVKMRLFQMMDLLGFAFVLAVTSLLFVAMGA